MSYTVTLIDFDSVSATEKQALEAKFRTLIEKVLGGPDGVAAAWQASEAAKLDEKDATFTTQQITLGGPSTRWDLMHAMATRMTFEDWSGTPGNAQFVVKA